MHNSLSNESETHQKYQLKNLKKVTKSNKSEIFNKDNIKMQFISFFKITNTDGQYKILSLPSEITQTSEMIAIQSENPKEDLEVLTKVSQKHSKEQLIEEYKLFRNESNDNFIAILVSCLNTDSDVSEYKLDTILPESNDNTNQVRVFTFVAVNKDGFIKKMQENNMGGAASQEQSITLKVGITKSTQRKRRGHDTARQSKQTYRPSSSFQSKSEDVTDSPKNSKTTTYILEVVGVVCMMFGLVTTAIGVYSIMKEPIFGDKLNRDGYLGMTIGGIVVMSLCIIAFSISAVKSCISCGKHSNSTKEALCGEDTTEYSLCSKQYIPANLCDYSFNGGEMRMSPNAQLNR